VVGVGMKGAAALDEGGRSKDHSDRRERGPQQDLRFERGGGFQGVRSRTSCSRESGSDFQRVRGRRCHSSTDHKNQSNDYNS